MSWNPQGWDQGGWQPDGWQPGEEEDSGGGGDAEVEASAETSDRFTITDLGTHFTQPWEAFMVETPGDVIKMRFPHNFHTMKFIAYDEKPIGATNRKEVQSRDPSYWKTSGEPIAYYQYDEEDNSYVLYPQPSTSFVNEVDNNDGTVLFADEDDEDLNTGVVARRTGSFDSSTGAPVDLVDMTDSVFMVYRVSPRNVESAGDEPDFPEFLRKYIRYGVVSRAYGANTDGRIKSLAEYWSNRFLVGIKFIQRYMQKKRQDRDYRLTTKDAGPRRTRRHPRLPDSYPPV